MVRILSYKSGGLRFNSRYALFSEALFLFVGFIVIFNKFNSVSNNEFNNGQSSGY